MNYKEDRMRVFRILLILFCGGLGFTQTTGARYLIITHDSYSDAIKPLADWKTQKGYKAKIVTLSEIGGSDSVRIRNYIVHAYESWQIKPEYLLIVGNKDQIPFPYYWWGQVARESYSDNYYTNVSGDFRNEMLPGRIWVYDTNQAKTVVAKILNYEKNPYCDDSLWFRKGSTIVVEDLYPPFADSVYWADARYAKNLMQNAGFVQIDTFSRLLGDNDSDVINAWNNGRSYILYRGIGYRTWLTPFQNIDTSRMSNGFKMPIIISATCATIEDIGYIWLYAGNPEQPKGAVGFFGTTSAYSNAAEYRSALAQGTLWEIFSDSFATLGKAAEAGRMNYCNIFDSIFEYNSWTCLGDPEMAVRTVKPRIIQITHSPTIWYGDTIVVQVKCDSIPVESALVCVMARLDTNKYHYGRTDNLGYIKFGDSLHYPDTAIITVTGRNLLVAVDTVIGGFQGGPCVKYINHIILDTVGGNGNYQPNNGENIELMVWVLNYGDSTARGVSGILQKYESDGYYQLDDTVKYFGDLGLLDSASTTADGFNLTISPICPDSHLIKLMLTVRDSLDNSWVSYFNIRAYCLRPYLVYSSNQILDSLGGNNDHQINPTENIELPIWLKNIGDSMAVGVTGSIQKAEPDPYLFVSDTIKNYGIILPEDSGWTGTDGYNIYTDSLCPDLHELKLRIKIRDSLDSTWAYDFTLLNHAPILIYNDYLIDDSVKYIRHGDTSRLAITIKNAGSYEGVNIGGRLICNDSFLTVLNADASFDTIMPDSIGDNTTNQFIIQSRPDAPPGYSTILRLALAAGPYRDTIDFPIYIGQRDYLIWDLDPNHSSGFIIHQMLSNLNYLGDYQQTTPYGFLNVYQTTFICAGIAPNNSVIADTNPIIPEILHYHDAGGKLYMEGGDVWFHDPTIGGYNFCSLFHIITIWDNSPTYTGARGYPNTFTRDMSFRYTGETQSIDRINPDSIGVAILKHRPQNFNCGVAADHKSVGISIEFSGLVDSTAPSTKLILADSIMRYFGITPSGGINENETTNRLYLTAFLELYPNPFTKIINIQYGCGSVIDKREVRIKIFDVTGRFIKEIPLSLQGSQSNVVWRGDDVAGRKTPSGIYFICLEAGGDIINKKIILLK